MTRTAAPLRIDGALDESSWAGATLISEFLLMVPREAQAPDESTAVRVLVDGERLVFGIWCSTRRPLRASLTPRDQITDGDHVSIHLDTDGDGQGAYIFGVNPYGVQLDGVLTGEPDFKWDAVWDAGALRVTGGWTAEIAVPFRAMRFRAHAGRPWRLWIRREIPAWNQVATWPLYRPSEAGRIMLQAADLAGLGEVRGGRSLTVEPYVFGSLSGARDPLGGSALSPWSHQHAREAGVDVQTSVGSSLALNSTWNPDFSQIEADALQIDLNRRFPLQFPEKRPFFLEGAENFASPLELVYSRRMADPQWGGKLTGRVGRLHTGALVVRDHGGALLAGSGFGSEAASAPGYFALSRALLPIGNGSSVGVLAGAHTQDAAGTANGLGGFQPDGSLNHIESADASIRLSDRWAMETQLVRSVAQNDSARADGARRRESFDGVAGVVRLNYRDRIRRLRLGYRYISPRYRDELGFQERVGVNYKRMNFDWNLFPEHGAFQRIAPVLDAVVLHDHTGRPEFADINPNLELEFRKNMFCILGAHEYVEHWQSRNYSQERAHVYFEDWRWRPLTWSLEAQIGDGVYYGDTDASSFLAWSETYGLTATARPSPRVSAAVNVQHLRLAHRPRSGEVLNEWLVGINTSVQFTRRLSVRIYPQYDRHARHLDVNGLVSYVAHPGTVVYLGVNSGFDTIAARRRSTGRQIFTKASYRFAL